MVYFVNVYIVLVIVHYRIWLHSLKPFLQFACLFLSLFLTVMHTSFSVVIRSSHVWNHSNTCPTCFNRSTPDQYHLCVIKKVLILLSAALHSLFLDPFIYSFCSYYTFSLPLSSTLAALPQPAIHYPSG